MKTGLIMEGGAMRGLFTCGVLDVWMKEKITFDGAVGVSAGAAFGCNLKSGQIGRAFRYNRKYCRDYRFGSMRSFLKTGDIYDVDFCYHQIPCRLDVFDAESFANNPMEFYAVCTDVETGRPVYYRCNDGGRKDLEYIRASSSMPIVSRIVEIDGRKLLDGGMSDSIPLRFFESIGYDRNVVILTQPLSYRKKKARYLPLARIALRGYPAMVATIAQRHRMYNEEVRYVRNREKQGEIFVVRPGEPLHIGGTENHPKELERVYRLGRAAGRESLKELKKFLDQGKRKHG